MGARIAPDATQTPCGVLLPFHQYFRQGEIAQLHGAMTGPLKKRIWQKIVRQRSKKIRRRGEEAADKHLQRVTKNQPKKGSL